jgi:hypothetical protein
MDRVCVPGTSVPLGPPAAAAPGAGDHAGLPSSQRPSIVASRNFSEPLALARAPMAR